MNLQMHTNSGERHLKRIRFDRFFSALTILALTLGSVGAVGAAPAVVSQRAPLASPTNTLQLHVFDATAPATTLLQYKFLINEDNTGDPHDSDADCRPSDPGLTDPTLANCEWPSIHKMPGNAPIVTQGTEADFPLNLTPYLMAHPSATKFLISVVADGYKIGGQHFTMPLDTANNTVEVELEPNPLPTLTFRAMVFNDNTSPNGAMDTPGEDGLNGFEGHLADVLGEISTDWFGNPLCTEYERDGNGDVILDGDGAPTPIAGTGGICLSGDTDHDGVLSATENNPDLNPDYGQVVIPNLGSNRFAATVVPPNSSDWVQTTTLEGAHDWDTWIMEGATGFDTEFLYQNELFPWAFFGFVKPTFRQVDATSTSLPGNDVYPGEVKGTAWAVKIYVPPQGGLNINHLGIMGAKKDYAVDRPYIALSDLNAGDQMVYMGRGNPDGSFDIKNVPPSDYLVTVWDGPQNLILDGIQIPLTVGNGVVYVGDTWDGVPGNVALAGWWTRFEGSVFIDTNENGKRDPGEKGLPQMPVALKMRGNSLMQHGSTVVTTDNDGHYVLRQAYPITVWIVMEVYSDLYMTTGITYQADNGPEITQLGQGVDVNVLPIIGLSGRLDWGVRPYTRTENGGIVGSISYDVTRNELDPRLAAAEDWQPGVPGLNVHLYQAVKCSTNAGAPCDPSGKYEVEADGSFKKGAEDPNSPYVSESWERPTGCTALDVDGNPVVQQALPTDPNAECVEAPMSGIQFGPMQDGDNFGATVDGNFGFGDIPAGDYLVEVEIPNDPVLGRPLYKVTREEDINVFDGDAYVPQVPPPPCAGPTHIVDVAGVAPDGPDATVNPNFADAGGSPYEGDSRPLCNMKLVKLQNGRSIAPGFNLFTDVPLPARYMGLTVDNLNLSTDPTSTMFGEVAGIPHNPFGVYDFNGRLLYTGESDPNGIWEVLMPSSLQINCPTPSGVCPNMYRFVGNDPGQPFHRNANWNPQYQTISVPFEAWPGVINPADLAPMPIAATIEGAGNQFNALAECVLPGATPKLFAVDKPYVVGSGNIIISGDAFGTFGSNSKVTLDGTALTVPAANWANGQITVNIPATTPAGPHQLMVTADNGQSIINGLTVHVLSDFGAFPATAVIDNFNRGTGNVALGSNWAGPQSQNQAAYRITTPSGTLREVQVRNTGVNGLIYWNGSTGGGPVYGSNQEAYFTFTDVSTTANEQDLLLKITGLAGTSIGSNTAMIEAWYDRANSQVRIETLAPGQGWVSHTPVTGVTFAAGDRFGARATQDGRVSVYKNSTLMGSVNVTSGPAPWPSALAAGGGRIGVWFIGTGNTAAQDARFDDFGGGTLALGSVYLPTLYEVGPGKTYDPTITQIDPITGLPYEHALQNALDAAANSANALVVVYPNTPISNTNPSGEYFENIVMHSPVKLQGVGPGGIRADGSVVGGSILDGIGYSPDATPSADWYALVASLLTPDPNGGDPTALGNPNISDGEVVYVLPTGTTQFTSAYKAAIDGFSIMGGDQLGFPANVNQEGGGQAGGGQPTFQGDVPTQGGGIYVHGYANNLQITNNILQSNGGAYAGAIRVGTPEVENNNHNLRIAYNRFLANGGTNLAGAIGLFRDSDDYEVANNDLCGNYSSEYGGAISHFGLSPNGKIHDNRIYWNQSVDEGAGIMVAGELPTDPLANYGTPNGPQGAGAVDIYNNLIQSNIASDDGGGLRFLMAGNFQYNVYNNFIVNNLSAHEGGGVALDDAPNVRFYNNTVMKNLSTDTAATAAFGTPYVAGLSTGENSAQLQATLPGGSPIFSNPLLFNNIFWDNRAGSYNATTAKVEGIGLAGDATPILYWDMGDTTGSFQLSPTNSILFGQGDISNIAPSASNKIGASADPLVNSMYDTSVSVYPWRSPNQPAPVIIAVDVPGVLPGDYHLQSGSPAIDMGAGSKSGVNAPAFDIDNQGRPAGATCLTDSGADEVQTGGVCADLSITKTDGVNTVTAGTAVNYTIVVANGGPSAVTAALVTDNFPAALTVGSWTCTATAGSSCTVGGSGNNRSGTVTLLVGGSATFTANTTLAASALGTLANTASVATPAGVGDGNTANNSATDTDSIIPQRPTGSLLDNFNRANANTLNNGTNWSQTVTSGSAAIRVNSNQAFANSAGQAIWNNPAAGFGAKQWAAFTFVGSATRFESALFLKATGGTAAAPGTYIRVRYTTAGGPDRLVVQTTTTSGVSYSAEVTLSNVTFNNNDTLTVMVDASGNVYAWSNTTYLGSVTPAGTWTGTGRIGMQLPSGARVDNFNGGTLP